MVTEPAWYVTRVETVMMGSWLMSGGVSRA